MVAWSSLVEAPVAVGLDREVAVVALERPVEIDHALDELGPEHADAAEIEQVEVEVVAHRVVAEMRVAVDHGVAVERHVPGAEHAQGQPVAILLRRTA